jgi:hypothetical protein
VGIDDMRKTVHSAIAMACVGMAFATAQAQDLQMTGTQAASRAGVPPRGITMAQVEQRYGAPASRLAAVGQPPITRWVYPSFVVFFEGNIVIHAVASSAAKPGG